MNGLIADWFHAADHFFHSGLDPPNHVLQHHFIHRDQEHRRISRNGPFTDQVSRFKTSTAVVPQSVRSGIAQNA